MIRAVTILLGVAIWTVTAVLWWDILRIRRLDRHIDEAVDLTRPIGPEDRADWGVR